MTPEIIMTADAKAIRLKAEDKAKPILIGSDLTKTIRKNKDSEKTKMNVYVRKPINSRSSEIIII
jgi:hypothetical protein